MGAWGPGILQNDTTGDIWAEFRDLYNAGMSVSEIRQQLEAHYQHESEEENYSEVWTGIAYGQWMAGELEEYTLSKVKASVEDKWLTAWDEEKSLLRKRKKALNQFISKIQSPCQKPINRKKIIIRQAFFQAGDVLSIEVSPDQHVAALVVDQRNFKNDGENRIVFTDCISVEPIMMEEALRANVFYLDIGGPSNYHRGYFWSSYSARNMARGIKLARKIGEVTQEEFLSVSNTVPLGDWNRIGELYKEQLAYLRESKSRRPVQVTVQDLLGCDSELELQLKLWGNHLFAEKMQQLNTTEEPKEP